MIWINSGYELEKIAKEAISKYQKHRLYIYGAGLVGTRTLRSIQSLTDWNVAGLIDRDPQNRGPF